MKRCPYGLVISKGIQKDMANIRYQAPTKWTLTSLCEKAFLKRSAIVISFSDPTSVAMCLSLLGSTYSWYALKMANQCTRTMVCTKKYMFTMVSASHFPYGSGQPIFPRSQDLRVYTSDWKEHIVLYRSWLRARELEMLHEKTLRYRLA